MIANRLQISSCGALVRCSAVSLIPCWVLALEQWIILVVQSAAVSSRRLKSNNLLISVEPMNETSPPHPTVAWGYARATVGKDRFRGLPTIEYRSQPYS